MKTLFCLCLSLLPLLAFAKDSRPAWVDGNAEKYPETKYITAVGNGGTRESAIENAKQAVASSFRQKVKSESNAESKSDLKEDTNAAASGEATSSSQSSVQITTNVELRGVEVKEFWEDPETHQQYALAVLDKLKVRNGYLLDLNRLKEHLLAAHESFHAKPEQKSGRQVLDLAQEYTDLAKEAGMVGTPLPATDPVSPKEIEAVRAKLEELKSAKPISVAISAEKGSSEEEAGDIQELVSNCLQAKGYAVAEGANGLAKLTGSYGVKSKHLKVEGFLSFDFRVKVTLNKKGGAPAKQFFTKNATGREQTQAFDNIKQDLGDSICAMIVQAL